MIWRKDMGENILLWNSLYPLDRYYRKKYNIPFGSVRHKEVNQVDVFFDLFEDAILEHTEQERRQLQQNIESVNRGEIRGTSKEERETADSFELIASQFFGEDVLRNLDE